MNRKIKYRAIGYSCDFVYGNFIHSKRFCGCSNEYRIHEPKTGIEHDILIETLGEFTGLKDKTGVDIYEGDILSTPNKGKGIVDWLECGFILKLQNETVWTSLLFYVIGHYNIEGNIHKNPELL